jgi:hypothetical protein
MACIREFQVEKTFMDVWTTAHTFLVACGTSLNLLVCKALDLFPRGGEYSHVNMVGFKGETVIQHGQ